MTDDRTPDRLAALDERGRSAAAGVRAAVAERPVPAFDPDVVRIQIDGPAAGTEERRGRRIVPLLAAAAAVLVVAAAVAALARSGGDDDSTPPADRVAPEDLRPYALGEVPDGFGLMAIVDRSEAEEIDLDGLDGEARVYGPDPTHPMLATAFVPLTDPNGCDLPDATTDCEPVSDPMAAMTEDMPVIDVGGRRAWDASRSSGAGGSVMVEVDDRLIVVFGEAASADALRRAAASVAADGDVPTIPSGALPDGWSALGEVPLLDAFGGAMQGGAGDGDAGWILSYGLVEDDEDGDEVILVGVEPGGPVEVGLRALVADEVEEVDVRGHDGRLARLETVPSVTWWTLRWEERPGEVVEVALLSSTGRYGPADAQTLAAGLVAVGLDELPTLRDEAERRLDDDDAAAVDGLFVGEGTFDGGAHWTFVQGPDGSDSLNIEVTSPGSSSASGSGTGQGTDVNPGDGGPLDVVGTGTVGDDAWAYGRVSDQAAQVEVRLDGSDQPVDVTIVERDGIRGWVADLPLHREGQVPPGEAIAYAADGTELARQRF